MLFGRHKSAQHNNKLLQIYFLFVIFFHSHLLHVSKKKSSNQNYQYAFNSELSQQASHKNVAKLFLLFSNCMQYLNRTRHWKGPVSPSDFLKEIFFPHKQHVSMPMMKIVARSSPRVAFRHQVVFTAIL